MKRSPARHPDQPTVGNGVHGRSVNLLGLHASCPRCGTPPAIRVAEAMAASMMDLDPAMLVGTYVCQQPGCGAVYDLYVAAYTAGFQGESLMSKIDQPSTADDANGSRDVLSVLEDLAGTVDAPADWAAEHDHYLYGSPKRGGNE